MSNANNLLDNSIAILSQLLRTKQCSAVELLTEATANIDKHDASINSFITVQAKGHLMTMAQESDKRRTTDSSPLEGLPYSVKDSYVTDGLTTTAASNVLKDFIPPYTATAIKKINTQGAVLVGKNNQDAWGHGGSTENTDFGPTHNPWNTSHTAGGSSGGTAAAIAARMAVFGIGEDTGGSIRNPASFCNLSGLKVTYGRVSRYGTIAYASSLDTVGPLAKSVEDLAFVLHALAGRDTLDGSSAHEAVPNYTEQLSSSLKGKVIGLPKEFFSDVLDSEVKAIISRAIVTFEQLGATCVDVSIPLLEQAIPIYYLLALSETSSNLARYDGVRFGTDRSHFTPETKRRIMLGTYALSAGYADELYKKAQTARTQLITEYATALEQCDVLLGPVTPGPAPKLGELINDPVQNMLADLFTVASNVVGVPSLAIPAGFSSTQLPIGIQLTGKKFAEPLLLNFGHQFQSVTDWHTKKPELLGGKL